MGLYFSTSWNISKHTRILPYLLSQMISYKPSYTNSHETLWNTGKWDCSKWWCYCTILKPEKHHKRSFPHFLCQKWQCFMSNKFFFFSVLETSQNFLLTHWLRNSLRVQFSSKKFIYQITNLDIKAVCKPHQDRHCLKRTRKGSILPLLIPPLNLAHTINITVSLRKEV